METNRWKQIVGKEVPEASYVKPFQLIEDYAKVLPLITVNSSGSMAKREEIEDLKNALKHVESENRIHKTRIEQLSETIREQEEINRNFKDILKELVEAGHEGDIKRISAEKGMKIENLLAKTVKLIEKQRRREGRYVY